MTTSHDLAADRQMSAPPDIEVIDDGSVRVGQQTIDLTERENNFFSMLLQQPYDGVRPQDIIDQYYTHVSKAAAYKIVERSARSLIRKLAIDGQSPIETDGNTHHKVYQFVGGIAIIDKRDDGGDIIKYPEQTTSLQGIGNRAGNMELTDRFLTELGKVKGQKLPERTAERILRQYPAWTHVVRRIGHKRLHVYEGEKVHVTAAEHVRGRLAGAASDRRFTSYRGSIPKIIVSEILSDDILLMLSIEKEKELLRIGKKSADISWSQFQALSTADNGYSYTDFDDEVLSLCVFEPTQKAIGRVTRISDTAVSRNMAELQEALQYKNFTELGLMAISLGKADTDMIPSGRTAALSQTERGYVREAYTYIDAAGNAQEPKRVSDSTWSRMRSRHQFDSQHELVMCAIKDGIVPILTAEQVHYIAYVRRRLASNG